MTEIYVAVFGDPEDNVDKSLGFFATYEEAKERAVAEWAKIYGDKEARHNFWVRKETLTSKRDMAIRSGEFVED